MFSKFSCGAGEARQQNCKLESFQFSAIGTELSDESGIAMASVLENSALQKFSFQACETEISDRSGTAFASSLCNSSLQSFSFRASCPKISDETCQAVANSIGNTCLAHVEFVAPHVSVSEETIICLQNALQKNRNLQFIRFETCEDGSASMTVQELVRKAMRMHRRRCEHKPDCPCLQLPFAQQLGQIKSGQP